MKSHPLRVVPISLLLMSCAGLEQQIYKDNFVYCDANRDAQLSASEWRVYMQDRYVKTARELGYQDKPLFDQKVFHKVDSNHDGQVSKAEYDQFILEGNTNAYFKQLP